MEFVEKLLQKSTVPVAPLIGVPGTQLNDTSIKQNLESAEVQIKTIKKLKGMFDPDIVFPIIDLSVEAEALGLKVKKPDNESYSIMEHPINDLHDLKQLSVPDPHNTRMSVFIDVVKEMARKFTNAPNVAYTIGPYSLAGLLSGAENTAMNTILQPEFLHETLKFATQVIKIYGEALIDAGADGICILEPTGSLLSPELYEEFSGSYTKELKQSWKVPVILHICGNTNHIISKMINTGCDGLSLDYQVDFCSIDDEVPEDVFIMGNIDPVSIIAYGNEEEVEKEVVSLMEGMRKRKSFVLSSGCDIPADAKLENIKTMFNIARQYKIPGNDVI